LARAATILLIVSAMTFAAGCAPPLTLSVAPGWVRVGGPNGVDATAEGGKGYRLRLAGGESEAVQVRVDRPAGEYPAPLAVTVDVAAVGAGPAGAETRPAPPVQVSVYQVLAVHHTGPADHPTFKVPVRSVGWIPDVCLPTRTAVAQAHEADGVTFLFDVHASAVAGRRAKQSLKYRLSFRHADPPGSPPAAEMTLTVDVLPFDLPKRLPFKTAVTWNWHIDKYLGRKLTDDERAAYLDFFARHRLTPASFWSVGADLSEAEVKRVLANGGNVFQVFGRGGRRRLTDKQKRALAPKLKDCRAMMKRAGAIDDCYALVSDEPKEEHIPNIRDTVAWLKGVFPEVKIWVATAPRKDLLGIVDCWDVVTAASTDLYARHQHSDAALKLARSARGKPEYWWFYSVEPYAPHANARLDNDLHECRLAGWMSYEVGVDGFEYFWATDWVGNADLRDVPWPAKAAKWKTGLSGAGQLCYPGDDGRPIPSLRLINLRDGVEDWAVLHMAGDKFRRARGKRATLAEMEKLTVSGMAGAIVWVRGDAETAVLNALSP